MSTGDDWVADPTVVGSRDELLLLRLGGSADLDSGVAAKDQAALLELVFTFDSLQTKLESYPWLAERLMQKLG
jgi:hypothetical protein